MLVKFVYAWHKVRTVPSLVLGEGNEVIRKLQLYTLFYQVDVKAFF